MVLNAQIQHFGEAGYIGWIDSIKGMVVQGKSREEVRTELLLSLKVKLAYNLGIDISTIADRKISADADEIRVSSKETHPHEEAENEKYKLELCLDIK